MSGVATNIYLRKMLKKTKKDEGLWILKMRVQELFMHEEGISTPHARHKGRQPLIECANHDFKIVYFFLFIFFMFSPYMNFTFWGRQGYFPRSYISSGSMRNSNLRSSLSLKVCVFD